MIDPQTDRYTGNAARGLRRHIWELDGPSDGGANKGTTTLMAHHIGRKPRFLPRSLLARRGYAEWNSSRLSPRQESLGHMRAQWSDRPTTFRRRLQNDLYECARAVGAAATEVGQERPKGVIDETGHS